MKTWTEQKSVTVSYLLQLTHLHTALHVCVFSGMFGFVFGLFGMLLYDGERVKESGMFQGYNTITWTVVALQVSLTPLVVFHDQVYHQASGGRDRLIWWIRLPGPAQVMPLSICVCVFVVSPGTGWSGHSSGHQICRQHPQGLCYIALHHPVNSYIVLLAAGLRPHWVEEIVTVLPLVHFLKICVQSLSSLVHSVFFLGAILVIVATFLYGYEVKPPSNPSRA